MHDRRRRLTEAGVVLVVLGAVAAVVVLPSALHAGFVADDWAIAESVARLGYVGAARHTVSVLGSKPLLGLLLPAPFAVFGTAYGVAHATFALTLGVATSAVLHALLRRVGFGAWAAGAAAVLTLVFPWSDAARFWLTGSVNQLAVLAYLLGVLLALRGFDAGGRRAVALHVLSVAAYVAAILTYEVVSAVVLATGALYLVRADRRRALRRWAVDVAVGGTTIVWSLVASVKPQQGLSDQLGNARLMAADGAQLAARAVVPLDGAGAFAAVLAVVAVLAAVVLICRRPDDPGSRVLRTWLLRGGWALAATALSWAPFVPSAYWTPLKPGLENRVNVLAALPLVVAVVALAHVGGLVLAGGRARWSLALTLAGLVAIGAGYAIRTADDGNAWERAAGERDAALTRIDRAVNAAPIDRIYLLGTPAMTAPGVPVFVFSYDLWGAVRVHRGDFTTTAYPALSGARLRCDRDEVLALRLPSPTYETNLIAVAGATSPYGTTWIVDARRGGGVRLADQQTCTSSLRSLGLL
jgi:hypothetical protein